MSNEKRLIDANAFFDIVRFADADMHEVDTNENHTYGFTREAIKYMLDDAPTVDAVEVDDKELLKAIKMLVKQYSHSKQSDYVHSPVAHALFHTWKKVDERRTDNVDYK